MSSDGQGIAFGRAGAVLLVSLALVSLFGAASVAEDATDASTGSYPRPDAEVVRELANEIVSSPEFMPRKTFSQWLNEKLGRWDRSHLSLPDGVGKVISAVIIIWCLLALLAILAHLGWTIWLWARPSGAWTRASIGHGLSTDEIESPEQLWDRSQALARTGAFREAMGIMLLALLRQLETKGLVSVHRSKTNGEYLAEYPSDLPGRAEFASLIGTFERSIYGGLPVAGRTYEAMTSAAKGIIQNVSQDATI